MDNTILRYSSVIILRPSPDFNLEVLFFEIDNKLEFLRQWLDHDDDPITVIYHKLKRITDLNIDVISINPVYIHSENIITEYYCCLVNPNQTISSISYYDDVFWSEPRSRYLKLKDEDR